MSSNRFYRNYDRQRAGRSTTPGLRRWYAYFYTLDPRSARSRDLIWALLDALDAGRVSMFPASVFAPDPGDIYITFEAPAGESDLYVLIGYAIEHLRQSMGRNGPAMRFR